MRISDPVKTQATRIDAWYSQVQLRNAARSGRHGPPRHRIERMARFVRAEPVEEDSEVPELSPRGALALR